MLMKKTVDIKPKTARHLRVEAAKKGISFKKLLELIIEEHSTKKDIDKLTLPVAE
jgi:hypothetical protein